MKWDEQLCKDQDELSRKGTVSIWVAGLGLRVLSLGSNTLKQKGHPQDGDCAAWATQGSYRLVQQLVPHMLNPKA